MVAALLGAGEEGVLAAPLVTTRWSTNLSSKVNLSHAIDFRVVAALCVYHTADYECHIYPKL